MSVIKIRRGNNASLPAGGTEAGEPRFSVDTGQLYVDDGTNNAEITPNATNVTAAGAAMASSNLSDLASAATARTNLGLGALATLDEVEQLTKEVWNGTASTIAAGTLVEIDGSAGAVVTVRPADPDTAVSADGITTEAIAASTTGKMQIGGTIGDLNTSGLTSGGALWLDDDGGFRDTAPSTGVVIRVGKVGVVALSGGTIVLDLPAFPKVASETSYDNATSGLTATNVKEAIDEVVADSAQLAPLSGQFAVNTVADAGATETLPATHSAHHVTMTEACTFTFGAPTAGHTFMLYLSGAFTPTFPASVDWDAGAAPDYVSPSLFVFTTLDAGTQWVASLVGSAIA